ncbi:RNA polymerase sigma-70 factor [Pseudoalteromonas luteoviolacea B = ATCC 29581]|nr:RNA polymerase sigma-70 factor [Pseudoalteromonas luteoviolacea B = ATCC 29581]
MTSLSEQQLVLLAQQGLPYDTRFFQLLVKPYVSPLVGYCTKLLNDGHDAEDAVQETLIKALSHLKQFSWQTSFRAWLYRIAHNECIDRLRMRQRWSFDSDVDIEGLISSTPSDNDDDFQHFLLQLMPELSWIDKNIMLLRYRTSLDFQEIADICEMKLSAVKMRHSRIIEALQNKFD